MNRLIALLWLLAATGTLAHGIDAHLIEGGAGIAVRYADGTPAAFAEVKIHPPHNDELFQEGLTDREGRFVFHPTTNGVWRIAVDDGMGHAVAVDLPVGSLPAPPAAPAQRMSRTLGILTGISLIWALFSSYGWWRARRS
ncbi:MAG TPA: hypothetical protein PKE12_01225 [Kiritimatiellia bacterium]|nr:hypothetical protein [Kiritimatiellia bacterium]